MLLNMAAVLLAPVLFLQGRYVRKVVPKLPEPDGPRAGCRGQGPSLDLLILGDSAAAGVGAYSQSEALSGHLVDKLSASYRLQWQLLAKTGHTTPDSIAVLHQQESVPFDVVVVSLGVNDLTSGTRSAVWLAQQAELVALIREKFGDPLILLSQLPPMGEFPSLPQPLRWYLGARSRRYNQALSHWLGSQTGCELLDFEMQVSPELMASDGFHPAPPFYQLWSQAIVRKIERQ